MAASLFPPHANVMRLIVAHAAWHLSDVVFESWLIHKVSEFNIIKHNSVWSCVLLLWDPAGVCLISVASHLGQLRMSGLRGPRFCTRSDLELFALWLYRYARVNERNLYCNDKACPVERVVLDASGLNYSEASFFVKEKKMMVMGKRTMYFFSCKNHCTEIVQQHIHIYFFMSWHLIYKIYHGFAMNVFLSSTSSYFMMSTLCDMLRLLKDRVFMVQCVRSSYPFLFSPQVV